MLSSNKSLQSTFSPQASQGFQLRQYAPPLRIGSRWPMCTKTSMIRGVVKDVKAEWYYQVRSTGSTGLPNNHNNVQVQVKLLSYSAQQLFARIQWCVSCIVQSLRSETKQRGNNRRKRLPCKMIQAWHAKSIASKTNENLSCFSSRNLAVLLLVVEVWFYSELLHVKHVMNSFVWPMSQHMFSI